jgi:serine beta-lactamase-like protein LACTB
MDDWKHIRLALIAVPPALLLLFIMGVLGYTQATKKTLHPDPQQVRSVSRSAPPPEWAGAVERSQQLVREGVAAQNLPGLSVAVGIAGDIVWAEGFGWANVENHVPATPETRFRAADVSRALTSAAVGLLLERNKVRLDDPVQVHVPEFPEKPWPVTLRQLMAQVGGVPDHGHDEPLSADVVNDDARLVGRCERTVDGLRMDDFAQLELLFEPGTMFRPSSYGWILVSAAVEAAAKEPFFSFMRTQIFEPLEMRDTTADVSTSAIPDRATFYFPRFDVIADIEGSLETRRPPRNRYGPKPARKGDYSCYAGAAGFLSTPSDLVRFGMAAGGSTLLRPETIQLLQAPQRLASGQETRYGLGWELERLPLAGQSTRMVGHGSREGFMGGTTSLMAFPESRLVVAVMTNVSYADTKAMALDIAQTFAKDGEPRK